MKIRLLTITAGLCVAGAASAGGLLLPGAGAISTARAGASVAATDDGEALSINPAGIAKTKGTVIQIGIAAIDYFMSFQRNGTYDNIAEESVPYAGQRYPTITNDPHPPLGIGAWQPVPVIAIVSDLGGRVPGLHAAFGIYAPSAYPFRDMTKVNGKPYVFNSDFGNAPPPSRYDIMNQEAAIILPSIAVSYRALPELDLGVRVSAGTANVKSTVAVWGVPANYEEWIKQDGMFTLDASAFVKTFAVGTAYRPTPTVELAAAYTYELDIHAQGAATNVNGPAVSLNGAPIAITPVPDDAARCAKGGTVQSLKGCVDFALPMVATVGGRYKFLDADGAERGDVELDVDWEHQSADRVTDYLVVVDAQVGTAANPNNGITLKDNLVRHGLQDTYALRLGGSYSIPVDNNAVIVRGGVSYDTAAAKPGWERADLDGAARTMLAAGASYKLPTFQVDAGFGVILEGTRTDPRTCNPTAGSMMGCTAAGATGTGTDQPIGNRQGPDPINPILNANVQAENPVNAGTYKSHYLMFMLGASYRF